MKNNKIVESKKLENDFKQQKSIILKLEKRIKSLESRKTVKKSKLK